MPVVPLKCDNHKCLQTFYIPLGGGGGELRFKRGQSFSLGGTEGYGDGRWGWSHKNMNVFNPTESYTCVCVCSVMSDSLQPHEL